MARRCHGFFILEPMATITALTPQKKNPQRMNVFVDGQFVCGLSEVVAAKLKVGQVVTVEEIGRFQTQELFEQARQSAIRLLEYRPRSAAEIQRHLRQKGFDEPVVVQVIEQLQQVELINDESFANYWVEQRETFRPRSQLALRQELQQKGISQDVMQTVLSQVDETTAAYQAAHKQIHRWASLPAETFRLKVGGFLQRRGFGYDVIKQVTKELWQELEQEK